MFVCLYDQLVFGLSRRCGCHILGLIVIVVVVVLITIVLLIISGKTQKKKKIVHVSQVGQVSKGKEKKGE